MDTTENVRREMVQEINAGETDRQKLEAEYGQCWDTTEMQQEFSVTGFSAPFVVVTRKSDGKVGSLMFRHSPRLYFKFQED